MINLYDFGLKVDLIKYCSQVFLALTSSNSILTSTLFEPNLQVCAFWKTVVNHSTTPLASKISMRWVSTHSLRKSACLTTDHLGEYWLWTVEDLKYFTFVRTRRLPFLTLNKLV